jgi:hypothetical protein
MELVGLKSSSSSQASVISVGSSVPMAVVPTGTSNELWEFGPDIDQSLQEQPQLQ